MKIPEAIPETTKTLQLNKGLNKGTQINNNFNSNNLLIIPPQMNLNSLKVSLPNMTMLVLEFHKEKSIKKTLIKKISLILANNKFNIMTKNNPPIPHNSLPTLKNTHILNLEIQPETLSRMKLINNFNPLLKAIAKKGPATEMNITESPVNY
jgi:hypothetical protein